MLPIHKRLFAIFFLSAFLVASCSSGNSNTGSNTTTEVVGELPNVGIDPESMVIEEEEQQAVIVSTSSQITVLETGVDGGPELTNDGLNDAGIHLRQFLSWTDSEQARLDLGAISFTDGGDRSSFADILAAEGGTLIALLPGLQSSSGVVDADIESIGIVDGRMKVLVRSQVVGNCPADSAFATPFRILHVSTATPELLFREYISPCVSDETIDVNAIGDITIDFIDDVTARIDWVPPSIADDKSRYEVIDTGRELLMVDITSEPTFTLNDIVPGIIYTPRIALIDANGNPLSRGTSIAVMTNAPSGLFRGRAMSEDLEALKVQFAGVGARNCGEFGGLEQQDGAVTEVSDCVGQALMEGTAFTADRVIVQEGFSFQSLVGDAGGNSWLLELQNSDVPIVNDFAPSTNSGGGLVGEVCRQPAVVVDGVFSRFSC